LNYQKDSFHLNIQPSTLSIISIKNDTKTSDQKKEKWIAGITNPAVERPGKVNIRILKPPTKRVTKYKTKTLVTQRKAPRVSILIGSKSKFKTGLINKLKRVKQIAAEIKIRLFSEKDIAPIALAIKKRQKKLMKIWRKKFFIANDYFLER